MMRRNFDQPDLIRFQKKQTHNFHVQRKLFGKNGIIKFFDHNYHVSLPFKSSDLKCAFYSSDTVVSKYCKFGLCVSYVLY